MAARTQSWTGIRVRLELVSCCSCQVSRVGFFPPEVDLTQGSWKQKKNYTNSSALGEGGPRESGLSPFLSLSSFIHYLSFPVIYSQLDMIELIRAISIEKFLLFLLQYRYTSLKRISRDQVILCLRVKMP